MTAAHTEKLAAALAWLAQRGYKPYRPVYGIPLSPVPTKEVRSLSEVV